MRREVEVKLTPQELAAEFCEMTDEQQADFFIECARLAEKWSPAGMQWHFVGRHLRDCSCSTEAAREMIQDLNYGLEHNEP